MSELNKITFDTDNVDIENIMEQVHERVKARGYDESELERLSAGLAMHNLPHRDAPLSEYAANVSATANVNYWWVMPKENPVKTFVKKVVRKLNYFYLKHTFDQQNIFNANTSAAISELSRHIDDLCAENKKLRRRISEMDGSSCDSFDYFKFENKFRGSEEDIRARQEKYLPYFNGKQNVLDIGCGRGEFLKLLADNGISAKGVDLSPENISECKGLDVTLADGIKYLDRLPDNSLGGIFCAQVIEHLSVDELMKLLALSHKKLMPGAKAVFETLNPQCLMIYAESMYMDPSHTKPVHPLTVQFMAEQSGFAATEILYSTPSDENMRLPEIDGNEQFNRSAGTINYLLFGNREYALICTK